jgi:serine protease Do
VGIAAELDLALLKVDGQKLPALPLATYSQVRQGETVFAFGSPAGLRNSLTHGLVSSVARQVAPDSPLIYIQTDAPINPGIPAARWSTPAGKWWASTRSSCPSPEATRGWVRDSERDGPNVFRQLKQFGYVRRQEIGISMQTITPEMGAALDLPRNYGVIVSDVWPGGPAEKAGVKIGDVLVSMDGQPVDNLPTVSYSFRLRDSKDDVQLVVLRRGTEQSLRVTPVEERSGFDEVSVTADPEKGLVARFGIVGVEMINA